MKVALCFIISTLKEIETENNRCVCICCTDCVLNTHNVTILIANTIIYVVCITVCMDCMHIESNAHVYIYIYKQRIRISCHTSVCVFILNVILK